MRKIMLCMFVCAGLLSAGCAARSSQDMVSAQGEIQREWIEEGVTAKAVIARGIGAADNTLENRTQRMATSRNAAIVNAQYNMLSLLKGVNLEGGITVRKALEEDSKLTTHLNDVIKGARIIRTEWTSDDGCVVLLKLTKKDLRKAGLNIPED